MMIEAGDSELATDPGDVLSGPHVCLTIVGLACFAALNGVLYDIGRSQHVGFNHGHSGTQRPIVPVVTTSYQYFT
jgi:hypothetical protein